MTTQKKLKNEAEMWYKDNYAPRTQHSFCQIKVPSLKLRRSSAELKSGRAAS
jgi:hypothetical protein